MASRVAIALAAGGVLLAGCSAGGKDDAPKASNAEHTSTSQDLGATQGSAATPQAGRAAQAENVQHTLSPQLTANEQHFGSGVNSPCSTSRSSMFTPACQDAADAVGQDAAQALKVISGKPGFATLRSTATRLQQVVGQYNALGCSKAPSETSVRHQCLAPAAEIAQGEPDLREGVNMGLSGQ
jgi:pectin methylesterase-like acyl-CoA thioesterase